MKQKISLFLFILGLGLVVVSFGLRESYEKEMYQLYIDQQKENLVEGWTKSWHDFLVNFADGNEIPGHKIFVDRSGRLLTTDFYPKQSKNSADWSEFHQLSKEKKLSFLKKQFEKNNTWDRAIAVKRWFALTEKAPEIDLSNYEKTLVDQYSKKAYQLLFEQIEKKSDYTNIEDSYQMDLTLVKANEKGEIELFVPHKEFLEQEALRVFEEKNNISEIVLDSNPFELVLKDNFNPLEFSTVREKVFIGIGFIFLISSIGFYFLELRNKKKEVLKKVSFLNQLVHEVKTPITGIRLNSELLKKHGHDEEIIEALLKSSHRLNEFFEDVVLINRDNSSPLYIKLSEDEWNIFIENIASEFNRKIDFSNLVTQSVFIDKGRVRVILRNLLKNAVRYGKKGKCEIYLEDNYLVFKVSDEGPGIALEDSDKIFDEFYRSKTAKNISPDGLGIGLSIVANLAKQMESKVKLVNPGEKNAVFVFKIGIYHES